MSKRRSGMAEATRPNLTWPEIRARAAAFARDWADDTSERAEAQTFWNEFFAVFGVQRRREAIHEKCLGRFGDTAEGRIDERLVFLLQRHAQRVSVV